MVCAKSYYALVPIFLQSWDPLLVWGQRHGRGGKLEDTVPGKLHKWLRNRAHDNMKINYHITKENFLEDFNKATKTIHDMNHGRAFMEKHLHAPAVTRKADTDFLVRHKRGPLELGHSLSRRSSILKPRMNIQNSFRNKVNLQTRHNANKVTFHQKSLPTSNKGFIKYDRRIGGKEPTIDRHLDDEECYDVEDWTDDYNFTCTLYVGAWWCNPDKEGSMGLGWENGIKQYLWPDSLQDYAHSHGPLENIGADKGCCACGGGSSNEQYEDEVQSLLSDTASKTIEEYPYEGNDDTCEDYKIITDFNQTFLDHFDDLRGSESESMQHEVQYWMDSCGYSCRAYYYGDFCTEEGQQGEGWSEKFGVQDDDYYRNGLSDDDENFIDGEGAESGSFVSYEACCACGGGNRS